MEEKQQPTYAQAVNELESIVQKMQSPDCGIDNLRQLTSRALEMLKICKDKLTKTDEELKRILAEIENEQ